MPKKKQRTFFNEPDVQGLKCKECKFRCHTQCEAQVKPNFFAIAIANLIVIANIIIIVRGIFTVITAICTITKNTL